MRVPREGAGAATVLERGCRRRPGRGNRSVTTVMIRVAGGSGAAGAHAGHTPFELRKRPSATSTQLPESVSKWDAPFLLGVLAERAAPYGKWK